MQNFFILLKKVVNSENSMKYKQIKPGKSKKERLIVTANLQRTCKTAWSQMFYSRKGQRHSVKRTFE